MRARALMALTMVAAVPVLFIADGVRPRARPPSSQDPAGPE
ncbi:MAG TPA: hypothetical protein VEH31_43270 [Streptosporangiaceae bacterium]|nr:hypothetical protein [Streptosporangiaceae bacterium]